MDENQKREEHRLLEKRWKEAVGTALKQWMADHGYGGRQRPTREIVPLLGMTEGDLKHLVGGETILEGKSEVYALMYYGLGIKEADPTALPDKFKMIPRRVGKPVLMIRGRKWNPIEAEKWIKKNLDKIKKLRLETLHHKPGSLVKKNVSPAKLASATQTASPANPVESVEEEPKIANSFRLEDVFSPLAYEMFMKASREGGRQAALEVLARQPKPEVPVTAGKLKNDQLSPTPANALGLVLQLNKMLDWFLNAAPEDRQALFKVAGGELGNLWIFLKDLTEEDPTEREQGIEEQRRAEGRG